MNLRNFAAVIAGRLRLIAFCALLFSAAGFCAARFWMPFHYEAYASLYVRNSGVTDERTGNVNINDLNASKSLAETYIAVLTSRTVMNEVSRQLLASTDERLLRDAFPDGSGVSPSDLLKAVKMSAVNDTEVMKITANTRNPEVSARICNIIANVAPSYLIRIVGAGSVEIIDEAVPNAAPVSPNIPLVTLIGFLCGFFLSALIAFCLDLCDDSVKDAEKLSKTFSKPILGEIQSVDADQKKVWQGFSSRKRKRGRRRASVSYEYKADASRRKSRPRRRLITDENIPFNIVEGYKSIRTNIVFALGTAPQKTIVVSSATPHEGKSTTAANIALAFSQIAERVLLIDADMRKPVMHRTFTADNSAGLSTLIISLSTLEDSIRRHVMGNLDLLPSGPLPPNPSELLGSKQFQTLLDALSQRYDYIIIDTPPMNVVSDAIVIRNAGGVMLVARYAQTSYEEIAAAMKKISLSGANMLGFALNDVAPRPRSYYRYAYYGYGYYGYSRRRSQSAAVGAKSAEISGAASAGRNAENPGAASVKQRAENPGAASVERNENPGAGA